jgi:hypothetical protein
MAKEFLDTPKVSTTIKHMGCEGMPDAMEGKVLEKMSLQLMLLHDLE